MTSGFFSKPSDHLDPALFEGDHLKEYVRRELLDSLCHALDSILGLRMPHTWVHAWLAGSGVSYQWEGDRGNGDLDVLFGADYVEFLRANPQFPRMSVSQVASYVTGELKDKLWPKTDHYAIDGKIFEVTFFWNPRITTSLDAIHPYAAYNLVTDAWDVRPPELPSDPSSLYPDDWFKATQREYEDAKDLQSTYQSGPTGKAVGQQAAKQMWEMIHRGRQQAFSDTGLGYGDFHNFRWQRAKQLGTVDILRPIVAEADAESPVAGIAAPEDILTRAALRYADGRYWT
jgi:hypothetical protein